MSSFLVSHHRRRILAAIQATLIVVSLFAPIPAAAADPAADPSASPAPTVDPSATPTPTPDPTPTPTPDPTPTPEPSIAPAPVDPPVPFIVTFASGVSAADQAAVLASAGASDVDTIPQLRMHAVTLPAVSYLATVDALRADPSVIRVEFDTSRAAEAAPSDAQYADQWSLPKIGWDQAFGTVAPAGTATVAILDTGIDASHPDLAGNVLAGTSILDGSDGLSDPNGHGTWLAGIIAAQTDNAIGIAGVGYAGVRVMPVTVLGPDGTGQDSDVIAGVVYAADHGADVILMAFSNYGYSASLQAAIDYAWSRGAVLVAATGNDGSSSASFPAGDRGVIGVSATDQTDALWASSNYGADTFLAAPGVGILATAAGGTYSSVTGTSTSAAEVAAAAALAKAVDPSASNGVIVGRLARTADPVGTADQTGNGRLNLARAIADTSTTSIEPAGAPGGGPLVGPYVVAAPIAGNPTYSGSPSTAGATASWTIGFTTSSIGALGSGGTVFVDFDQAFGFPASPTVALGSGFVNCSGSATVASLPPNSKRVTVTLANSGGTCSLGNSAVATLTIAGITNPSAGSYSKSRFGVFTSQDSAKNPASDVIITANTAPTANAQSVSTNEDIAKAITLSGTDPDGNSLTFAIVSSPTHGSLGSLGAPSCSVVSGTSTCTASITYTPTLNYNGSDSFTFKVNDGTVDSGAATVSITVTAVNDPPTITDITNQTINEDTSTGALAFTVGDVETAAGSLTLSMASTNTTLVPLSGIVFVGSEASRTVTVTPAADQNGTATITVTVTDGDGASTSDTFLLTVTPVNDAPSGADNAVTINEDASYTFATADFGFSDPSDNPPNTLQAVKITTLPGAGSLKDNGVAVTTGQFVPAADITGNKLVFTPVANANGTPYTSFTFQVQDNGGTANNGVDLDQSPNTFTINVTAVNDDPVIVSVTNDGPISEGSSATITVSATDVDGDTLHYGFDCGHDGTFEIGPQLSSSTTCFFADPGSYQVDVRVTDGNAGSALGSTTVTVTDVIPTITVTKTPGTTSLPEPGGPVSFTVTVKNNDTAESIHLNSLMDSVYGDLLDGSNPAVSSNTCASASPTIAVGATLTCSFTGAVSGQPGDYFDTVTAHASDNEHNDASDHATAKVTITDIQPSIVVTKTASPTHVNEPGAGVTFTVTVKNTSVSSDPVTLDSLADDTHDNLAGQGTCAIGGTILPGATYTCAFSATVSGNAAYTETDTVTAHASDDEANDTSGQASATVTVDDVAPSVTLVKEVLGSDMLPEPGGTFTFKLTITNNSVTTDPVTITTLTDDNPLSAACLALVGTTVAPGDSVDCTYTVSHDDADTFANTASVSVTDDEGSTASSSDGASVTVTNVAPSVELSKAVDPTSRPEPGGLFTYTLTIHNTSADAQPVEITALSDTNALSSECTDLVGTFLAPDETVSCTYTATFENAGIYGNTASVTVEDNEATTGDDTALASVTVADVAPTIQVTKTAAPTHVNEPGGLITFTVTVKNTSVSSDPVAISSLKDAIGLAVPATPAGLACQRADTTAFTIGTSVLAPGETITCTFSRSVSGDGPTTETDTVTVVAADDDTGGIDAAATASATVTVNNVAPSALSLSLSATSIFENGSTSLSGNFADPGTLDTHTVSINWGDGSPIQTVSLAAGVLTFTGVSHQYLDDNPTGTSSDTATISVTVTDDDGDATSGSTGLTITNVAPSVSISGDTPVDEGSALHTYTFTTTDPGTLDTFTYSAASCGASGAVVGPVTFNPATGNGSFDCRFVDDSPTATASDLSTVSIRITDDDTGYGDGSKVVTVNNVAPVLASLTSPTVGQLFAVGTPVNVSAGYTDVGTLDTHRCWVNWDDGAGFVDASAGSGGSCTPTHTFLGAGVYTIEIKVRDDDTGESNAMSVMVVVYDPSAGFVTGGGWINSLAGSYTPENTSDPDLVGKATFGFVSKYQKGASVPVGQTEFQFQVANFNFHSESYQWLVVSGYKAQYRGTGTVNGAAGYSFLVTAYDGQVSGGTVDKFRIRIWVTSTSTVVYDNKYGTSTDMDAADPQALGGGSIVIHK